MSVREPWFAVRADSRDLVDLAERADDAVRAYAAALFSWNRPDDAHTRHQLRSLIDSVIADGPELVTHGRHCKCSACAQEDWTCISSPCGMHGSGCPAVYAPIDPWSATSQSESE